MAQTSLTARPTSRADAKAGHSDPVVLSGRAIAQRLKGTPGITGLSLPRVHIDGEVWHLDVGSSHPGAGAGPKGLAVRQLKWYASWVQNVVRQFGPYPLWALDV
ncbi:RNAase [Plakobranchus ocellatus]|uniref:RNAase n=1 Tax=Plakobranchus ocellatus TaxID=259542 RepID=A0AAV4BWN2_9GAST|nr:RNAase [Plakobranchus ocellatus]